MFSDKFVAGCGDRDLGCIFRYSVASRILMISLILIWRSLLSSYDTSSSITPPCLSSVTHNQDLQTSTVLFPNLGAAIERSIVWDGVYFVRIAECGYEYEQSYAFFPLLPICISLLSKTVFAPLVPVIGYRATLGFSGYVLNNIAFVFSALYLFRLSLIVLKDRNSALRASILFCFNPASIFYSSVYSESLYAFASFGGLYYIMNGVDYSSSFLFAISSCTRSNGIINIGYICFRKLLQVYDALLRRKGTYLQTLQNLLVGALCSLVVVTPFITFQAYGYYNICKGGSVTETQTWCKAKLPLMYNYIQGHYWGVGFLKYFEIKQIPNFLLALPTLSLSFCSILYYMKHWLKVFLSSFSEKKHSIGSSSSISSGVRPHKLNKRAIKTKSIVSDKIQHNHIVFVPFVLHLTFLSATALFMMHVQVATRFLSSSPVLYWFASQMIGSGRTGRKWGYVIWAYCSGYILIGSLLFSNFYPFT